ncbi:MAG: type III-A CRISPR-associated RAMP protein Csm4 [Candidatus Loosdrechtia sp.]|uniref:type III-A CRISPR-associated RAMP protein Csm4 n=1 Tax=Candidatus Loosdrechtia sp. TaxID=3101272 RepID=UPI003A64CF84|nr:MAG: type III-A CRISPR-associated RAMP protein Csm4 [Candidatus Jettenia sp. AMX2]
MEVYIYRLEFKGPTHFGETGIDLENVGEWVSSDTLFSALINTMSNITKGDAVSEFIDKYKENPPFLLSSLFLYNNNTYFLPRPMYDDHIPAELKREKGKVLKKIKWLSTNRFQQWMNNTNLSESDLSDMESSQKSYKEAFSTEIRPRVSLDRITQSSNIYHCGYVHFRENAGLYGLVAFNDLSLVEKVKELLTILGETGLGGERTYGCGTFKLICPEKVSGVFKEILESKTSRYTLLSLYHPAEDEKGNLSNRFIAYDVIRKCGWITTGRYALPLKRKSVGFIREGSVSKAIIKGTLVDVTPDNPPPETLTHKIYRYGYAFTVPLGR